MHGNIWGFSRVMISMAAVLSGFCVRGDGLTVGWSTNTLDWLNFNTPSAWNNGVGPGPNDNVNIGVSQGQVSNVRIDSELPPLKHFFLSYQKYTTTTVEVATGGKLVLTNNYSETGAVYLGLTGTSGRGYLGAAEAELRVTGGTIDASVVTGDGNPHGELVIGSFGSKEEPGSARVTMSSGRIRVGNGVSVGRNDNICTSRYEQTGGRLELMKGNTSNGITVYPNGSLAITGGEVLGSVCNNTFNGPSLIRNATFEYGAIYIGNLNSPLAGYQPSLVMSAGAVVTGNNFKINEGVAKLEAGAKLNAYSIMFVTRPGQQGLFQMEGGTCKTTELNLSQHSAGGGVNRFIQSGGTLNGSTSLQVNNPMAAPLYVEISGGTFDFSTGAQLGYPVVGNACTNSMTFCIRGTPDRVAFNFLQRVRRDSNDENSELQTNRIHHLYLIDPRGLSPLTINTGGEGAVGARFAGHCSVHPWGGVQLVTNDTFVLIRETWWNPVVDYNDDEKYAFDFKLARPDARLWHWQFLDVDKRERGVTLTNTAAVAHGFRSATGVPCGYFELPSVRTQSVRRVSVRLGLEPKGTKTLADIVAELNGKSGCTVTAETHGDCNVRLELPLGRLGNRATNRKLLFDFTREESPKAFERGEIITDAVVTALDYEQINKGTVITVR